MKKLSVIVPIYNVEKFLRRCIDSIINQSYSNLEIILVDDGSPDNCGKICDEYAALDNRIKVIHQANGGLSAARNIGIDSATGEYVAFIDSDDYIASNMYDEMISLMETNDLDIISCNAFIAKGKKIIGCCGNGELEIYDRDTILVKALQDYDNSAWNKVYKKEAIGKVRFPVGRIFEDTATAYLFFNNIKKAGHINKAYYYYYRNPNSITQTAFNVKARYDFVLGYIERLNFAKKYNIKCVKECKSLLMKAVLSCLTAVYVSEKSPYNNNVYRNLKQMIIKYRDDGDAYCLLNFKYKIFLWSFNRVDFIHKFSAKLSMLSKKVKTIIKF